MSRSYVLKNRKRFCTVLVGFMVMVFSLLLATSVQGYREPVYNTVIVRQGDSLWSLAAKYKKSGDMRKYIYEVKKLNNLKDSSIYTGDTLIFPEK